MQATASILATTIALLGVSAAARADLMVVTSTTVSGLPAAMTAQQTGGVDLSKPIATTIYYKGDRQRTETVGTVVIAGSPDGKLYTLNPVAKTYYATSPGGDAASDPILSMMEFNAKAIVHPGGDKQTVLGCSADDYKFEATMSMTMKGMDPSMSSMLPTIKIHGVEWTTASIVPPKAISPADAMTKFLPASLMGGMKQMITQFAAIKGYPLLSDMQMNIIFPKDSPMASMGGGMIPKELNIHTEVKSVSEDPVPDALFAVPADYKLVAAPVVGVPGMPGGAPAQPATTPPTPATPATPETPAVPATPPAAAP